MTNKRVPVAYLASPIDRVEGGNYRELQELRDECRVTLDNFGFSLYDPNAAWYVPKKIRMGTDPLPLAIALGDFAVVDSCDVLLAILPDTHATIGVPMEIERAIGRGIPVVVIGDGAAARSPLLAGRAPVYNRKQIDLAVRHLLAKLSSQKKPRGELKVTGDGKLPSRTYADDCGFDLFTYIPDPISHPRPPNVVDRGAYQISEGGFCDIDCGVEIELPEGVWGLITGRSSAIRKRGLLVVNGIIDTGFRGRLFMPVLNVSRTCQYVERGERIGQLILMQNVSLGYDVRRVDFLSPSERGTKGFGSSGT